MADFLPIGLGRDANGNVSGFQEIKTTDIIPENYLEVNNETAKWNASGLVGYSVSAVAPTNAYVLTWDSSLNAWVPKVAGAGGTNAAELQGKPICVTAPSAGQALVYNSTISAWCPSTIVITGGGGGTIDGTGTTGRIVTWVDSDTIGNWTPAITDGHILEWDSSTSAPVSTGYTRTDAGWNADKIQGVSACPTAPSAGQALVYNSTIGAWCPSTLPTGGGGGSDATSIHGYPVPDPDTGPQPVGDVLIFTGAGYDWEPRVKSTNTLTANKILIGDGDNSVCASPITLSTNTFGNTADGNVIRFLSATPSISDGGWGIAQAAVTTIGNDRILQWSTDGTRRRIVDSGYTRTDAGWNADKIQGVSATLPTEADDNRILTYNHTQNRYTWTQKIQQANNVGTPGELVGGSENAKFTVATSGGGSFIVSGMPDGTFLVASGGTVVPAYLPSYMLRYFGTNGTGSWGSPVSNPAEVINAEGQFLYYDATNQRYTNTGNLKVVGNNNLTATNVSATTVSATNITATDLTFSGKISSQKYPTYIYTATGISVAANKLMFDMFNGTGSGKTLKVTRIVAYVRNTTTITGINQVLECYRTSSVGTGGTTITESKMVTTDPNLNANITARNTPTNGAAYYIPSGVLAAANIYTEEGQNLQERVFLYVYDSFAGLEECLTLREGEGLRIITGAVGAAGVIAIYAYFITV